MNIYLVRHGRQSSTLCNVNVDLSEEGIQQVDYLAERLKDVPLDAIYSSNLTRAIQTAERINQYHNQTHEIREGIQEIDFGDWTGLDNATIHATYGEWIAEQIKLTSDLAYPGGENGQAVIDRAMPVIEEILQSGKEHVLVVTHGGVIRALTAHLLGLDLAKKGLFGTALEHTSITEFVYDNERKQFYLQRFNDHAHLEGKEGLLRHGWK